MDSSWYFENEEKEEESESDEEDKQTELEERLYAVVHHNDLSQPLSSELAKYYSIECADNGELEVSLNNSLEVVKSNESETICNLLTTSDSKITEVDAAISAINNDDDDDVVIISSDEAKMTNKPKPNDNRLAPNGYKRFRYSDVTLDEFQGQEKTVESTTNDIYYFDHNLALFHGRKNRKFRNLKIPPPISFSDWKNDSTKSFISIGSHIDKDTNIIQSMTEALVEVNPGEKRSKLVSFARILYRKNLNMLKNKRQKEQKKARKLNRSVINDSSVNNSFNISKEIKDLSERIKEYKSEFITYSENATKKQKGEDHCNGSVSLNISPFKPDPSLLPQCLDFTSDIDVLTEFSHGEENSSPTTEFKHTNFPSKWTKQMIKFYSKRCKKELNRDIKDVITNLRRKSKAKDWYLEPRDQTGSYQRHSHGANRNQRCKNCNERGHLAHCCYRPLRLPACTLCGELYHTDYSCPNKVCLKCGLFIMNDVFGGECNDCYYATFNGQVPCNICQEVTHKSEHCTDLWRSFHATTGGKKKIPDSIMVNKRKSCCNCGRKGHFSHECPFITYSGQQISSFVKNYSAEPMQIGSVDVMISKNYTELLYSDEADQFFHYLSDHTQAVIGISDQEHEIVCKINGTIEQCTKAKLEIESFLNTRKRKRQEPKSKRKRQRIRY